MSGQEIGGRYQLQEVVGRGGMGAVWSALDLRLQRRVAVKLMSAEQVSRPAARERFEQEALAVAKLTNLHVVQIHDAGIDGDAPYIVMELLDGEDLNARFQRLGKLPPSVVAPIVAQIARALEAAHAKQIVHRDLKPDNVFLARGENGEETVKVLDFGLAALAASLSDEGAEPRAGVLGTPHYMSPEQVRGSKWIDHRSDLWSLAVLAYRGITGVTPFVGEVLGEILLSVCVDTPPPPSRLAPELAAGVDAFFERALAKDPAQRYPSSRELSAAFTGALDASVQRSKILIVDDEPDIVVLLKQHFRHQLRASIYEIVFAADGLQALEALRQHPDIDLTLTDIRMPEMDGLTFLARARELRPEMPVVVVSAFGDMPNIRTAMNRGAFDFLVKPFDLADLGATIAKGLQHAREIRTGVRSALQNAALRMFVGDSVADRLRAPLAATDALADERIDATVVCLRVRGFDGGLDGAPPAATVRRLNACLEVVIPELIVRGGVVEKLFGSTVIALFQGDAHATRALGSVISVRDQIHGLSVSAPDDSPYARGVSAGVATGSIVRGCTGSKAFARLDYALLGEVVTLATRLAGQAAPGEILVPEPLRGIVESVFEVGPARADRGGATERAEVWSVQRRMPPPSRAGLRTVLVEDGETSVESGENMRIERTGPVDVERTIAASSDKVRG